MCYSKEVSLIVAMLSFVLIISYWEIYVKPKTKHLNGFFKMALIAAALIAGHQLSEFFSIWLANEFIYKIGLIISFTGMIFFMKSLEELTDYSYRSNYAIIILIILGTYIFITPMSFADFKFWVRGYDHGLWSMAWLSLFVYWNVCTMDSINRKRSEEEKSVLKYYAWGVLNITFLTALFYFLIASIGKALMIFEDLPSIWCTIGVIQLFFYPYVFNKTKKYHHPSSEKHEVSLERQIFLIILTILIVAILWNLASFVVPYLSEKLLFK
ncbi:MAG: hypothetical protein PVJ67_00765 [Candidatus Pacearchaeota archaeon]|jgi:hypothetical protein